MALPILGQWKKISAFVFQKSSISLIDPLDGKCPNIGNT
jgi:hypothetical protein